MWFDDISNPTPQELRRWASIPNANYPDQMSQDWDIAVADWSRIAVIVELVTTAHRTNREFFLGVLYLMAGDCVRNSAGQVNIPNLHGLLDSLEKSRQTAVRTFVERARTLLADPSAFDYHLWCDQAILWGDRGTERDIALLN